MRQAVSRHRERSGLEMLQRNFPGKLTQAKRTMQRLTRGCPGISICWGKGLRQKWAEGELSSAAV